jgi:hypothetical protein
MKRLPMLVLTLPLLTLPLLTLPLLTLPLLTLAVVCGCSSTQQQPKPAKALLASDEAPPTKAPAGSIDRRYLEDVLREGPSWILQRVPIEEVMSGGKFIGWRVQRFPSNWAHIDIRPGDIVRRVNGMPIETPDRFWSAWTTLTVASELTIGFERDGQPRELRIPIWGSPDPTTAEELKKPRRRKPKREHRQRETIIIRPPKRPESGSQHKW